MDQTRQMRHYLKQIKRLLPSDYAGRKKMLAATRQRIRDYLKELSGSRREQKPSRRNKWFIIDGCILVIPSAAVL